MMGQHFPCVFSHLLSMSSVLNIKRQQCLAVLNAAVLTKMDFMLTPALKSPKAATPLDPFWCQCYKTFWSKFTNFRIKLECLLE